MANKLLLATTCLIACAAIPSVARAQPAPAPTVVPTPVIPTLLPSPVAGPGTISVRLNARVNFYVGAYSDSGRHAQSVTTTPGSAPTPTNTKLADYTFGEYGRFFPAFDGVAGNGLKYGAFTEIRQDNSEPPGGGVNGSISAGTRNRDTIYFRRAFAYIGADKFGIVRFGQGDGPASLMATGTFENFNDGGWNGDTFVGFTANTQVTWPFATSSGYASTTKIVYLSPQIFGADFGVSFEPNTGNGSYTPGNCNYNNTAAGTVTGPVGGSGAGQGCDAASATTTGDYTRRRNTIEAVLRYRTSFGAVGLAAEVGGIVSGRVNDDSTPQRAVQYDDQRIGDGGMQITYGGLAFGGHVDAGRVNGALNTLAPRGQKDEFAWLAGGSYALGNIVVGASYYDVMSAGAKTATTSPYVGNRNEVGVAAGGTYTFAPGMLVYLSYLYGTRKELGYDLLTGVASAGTAASGRVTTHNHVQAQGLTVGTQFRW